ncbi:MAG TPA: HIT domain-containing protein [Bryobacteraceae bacterium]|nr:HIT domain-containing protein [Bryobacteraceae bacterium]
MDQIWSPWRYQYVTKAAPPGGCVFCAKAQADDDQLSLIVHRGRYNYVVLNLYPYTNGHVMVVPFAHVDSLAGAAPEAAAEMMELARRTETILRQLYRPPGINIGMNLGECAGAGVAGHIHLHLLPRWPGDANFMTVIGETRVHIEELATTWTRLRDAFAAG